MYAVCDAARRAGYPVKIALIASRSDLGPVNSGSLAGVHPARATADSLADAAVAAVTRLAGAAGHPVAVRATVGPGGATVGPGGATAGPGGATAGLGGASATTVRNALIAMLVLALLAAVAISFAFSARSRRLR